MKARPTMCCIRLVIIIISKCTVHSHADVDMVELCNTLSVRMCACVRACVQVCYSIYVACYMLAHLHILHHVRVIVWVPLQPLVVL